MVLLYELIYSRALSITPRLSVNSKSAFYMRLGPQENVRNNIYIFYLCFALVVFLFVFLCFLFLHPWMVTEQRKLWKMFGHLMLFCYMFSRGLLPPSLAVCLCPFPLSSAQGSPAPQRDWFVVSCCSAIEENYAHSRLSLPTTTLCGVCGSLCESMWDS